MSGGAVVWITGRPASGKSTLARAIAARVPALVLDGDEVRDALRPRPGYDDASRDAFYETLARLAALAAAQGLLVIVAATAHRRAYRERARELAPRFLQIFVDTPPEECARRDPKGLYAAAARGEVEALPGATLDYEAPLAPDVVVRPGDPDPAGAVLAQLRT